MIRIRFAEALWLFEHPSKEARVAGQGAKRSTVLDYLFRLLLDCDCILLAADEGYDGALCRSLQYTLTHFLDSLTPLPHHASRCISTS